MAELNSSGTGSGTKVTDTTVTKTPQVYGGMFSGSDIATSLLNVFRGQQDGIAAGNEKRLQAVAEGQAFDSASVQGATDAMQMAATNAETKAGIEYMQNSMLQGLQTQLGMNPADLNNEIAKNLAVRNTLEPQLEQARSEYDAAASTDLLSNPIGFIFAQLKLPTLAAKNNAIAENISRADDNITKRTQMLAGLKTTLHANTADSIRALAISQAKVDTIIAQSKLDAAQAANRAHLAGSAMQDIQVVNMQGDNARQTLGEIARLKDMQEQRTLRQAQMNEINERRKEILDAKKKTIEEDARLDARLKIVSDQLGMVEPMTVDRLRKLTNKQEQQNWLGAALEGQFGSNAFEATNFFLSKANRSAVAKGGADSVYLTAQKVRDAGSMYQGIAEQQSLVPGAKKLTPEEARAKGFELYTNEILAASGGVKSAVDLASGKWDKTYNPQRAPVLAFHDAVQTTPALAPLKDNLVAKMIGDLAKTQNLRGDTIPVDSEQQVIGAIRAQIRAGQLTPAKAAADISEYYKAASDWNQALNKPSLMGVPPPSSYFFSIEAEGSRDKTNLFNPVEIERQLVRQVVKSRDPVGFSPIGGFR